MPFTWTPEADRKLLLLMIKESGMKMGNAVNASVAAQMANGITAKAVENRIVRLKTMVKKLDGDGDGDGGGGGGGGGGGDGGDGGDCALGDGEVPVTAKMKGGKGRKRTAAAAAAAAASDEDDDDEVLRAKKARMTIKGGKGKEKKVVSDDAGSGEKEDNGADHTHRYSGGEIAIKGEPIDD